MRGVLQELVKQARVFEEGTRLPDSETEEDEGVVEGEEQKKTRRERMRG